MRIQDTIMVMDDPWLELNKYINYQPISWVSEPDVSSYVVDEWEIARMQAGFHFRKWEGQKESCYVFCDRCIDEDLAEEEDIGYDTSACILSHMYQPHDKRGLHIY